jgi:hypothetical protein
MIQRKQNAQDLINAALDEDIDPTELSRLAAEFRRQQEETPSLTAATQPGLLKRSLPYIALAAAAALAVFAVYRTTAPPLPVTVGSIAAPRETHTDEREQAAVLPDKLRQISNCETDSMRTYPNQSDVRALQYYNLCMTGAGFTPNYSCNTAVGIPAYNPDCWNIGANL